jgi:hypothetical protein
MLTSRSVSRWERGFGRLVLSDLRLYGRRCEERAALVVF